jgi:TonB family protein
VLEPKSSELTGTARHACTGLGLLMIFLLSVSTSSLRAQTATPNLRKVVYKVAPKYPRELKQNEIGGVVRLSISISPNGSVAKVTPVGGNPILVDAATQAVKQWKYAPSDRSTTTEVQLDFIPHQQ